MSQMSELLRLPGGIRIPDELEAAWRWMEDRGWGATNEHGYYLTPYAGERQLGIVFDDGQSLEGWFLPPQAQARLVPLAEIGGDGSMGALWVSDDGRTRFVGLGSDGDMYVLADDAVDFLRLIAVGYHELSPVSLGLPPDEPEAVSEFRAWVEATYAVEVPAIWPAVVEEGDEFATWMHAQMDLSVEAPET